MLVYSRPRPVFVWGDGASRQKCDGRLVYEAHLGHFRFNHDASEESRLPLYKYGEFLSSLVEVLKSVVQPESHRTSQTGHLGDTCDRRSVQGAYLDNQKEFAYETNSPRCLAD